MIEPEKTAFSKSYRVKFSAKPGTYSSSKTHCTLALLRKQVNDIFNLIARGGSAANGHSRNTVMYILESKKVAFGFFC